MASNRSAEDVEQEHLTQLGPDLGPVYHALWEECVWLCVKWQEYEELFGVASRVDLLNRAGSTFFRIVQDALLEAVLLQLTALTDPPKVGRKTNLTVAALPSLISDSQFRAQVEPLVAAARKATGFARDRRNRSIAHRDLALALGQGAKPLAPASRIQVSEAIDAVCAVLSCISVERLGSDIAWKMTPVTRGGVDVLYVLRDGLQMEEERQQRIELGKWDPECDDPGPL